jgi:uncharacterized membrane protein YedE/YeeE
VRRRPVSAYLVGLLFGAGLVVSGMTDPRNVVGFLDFAGLTGRWNPALIGVMSAAVVTHALLLRLLALRAPPPPVTAATASASPSSRVDRSLVFGSVIFGVGWGLSGYCPGPAIVSLGFGAGRAFLFVAALIMGSLAADGLRAAIARARAVAHGALQVSEADR